MDEETLKKTLFQIIYDEKMAAMGQDEEKLKLLRAKHKVVNEKLRTLKRQKMMKANLKERGR